MAKTITIPAIGKDERMGSVLSSLFYVISETENSDEDVLWDFSNLTNIHPFFVAPLSIYKYRSPVPIQMRKPFDTTLKHYFQTVCVETPLEIIWDSKLEMLQKYSSENYTPISRFNIFSQTEEIQSIYKDVIHRQEGFNKEIAGTLSYVLSELMDNMVEHSMAKYGFIFSQYSDKENTLDICIADDGISVLGSFMRKKKDFVLTNKNNEAEILKFATEGVSTKNLPHGQNRGFGLSTSKKMLVDGLCGEFYMMSGNAFHQHNKAGLNYINLPPNISWPGTIILLKIPMERPSNYDYLNFIQ